MPQCPTVTILKEDGLLNQCRVRAQENAKKAHSAKMGTKPLGDGVRYHSVSMNVISSVRYSLGLILAKAFPCGSGTGWQW